MYRAEQLTREAQASQDDVPGPHNHYGWMWIAYEMAAEAVAICLKRSLGSSYEMLKEALESGTVGTRDAIWKRPFKVLRIDDDVIYVAGDRYPDYRRQLRRVGVQINRDDLSDWLFERSMAESPPATDDIALQSSDEQDVLLVREKKGGNKDAHDWGEGQAFFDLLWETKGDPALPENQAEGWRTDGDIWTAISEHLGRRYDKEKRKLKAPDPSTVGKKFRYVLEKLREVQ